MAAKYEIKRYDAHHWVVVRKDDGYQMSLHNSVRLAQWEIDDLMADEPKPALPGFMNGNVEGLEL